MYPSRLYFQEMPNYCPHCGANLIYTALVKHPDRMKVEKFSRAIGIYDLKSDRTIAYRCPDCHQEWERSS